jgi:hypothetical protein
MARLQQKKQAAVTTGSAETSRHSPRNGWNGLYVVSPGIGLIAPVARALVAIRRLDLSIGRSGPHDFTVRIEPFVRAQARCSPTRPPHPAPTSVTIAIRPSSEAGRTHQIINSVKTKEIYFYPKGWTGRQISRNRAVRLSCNSLRRTCRLRIRLRCRCGRKICARGARSKSWPPRPNCLPHPLRT